ncbi:MULTISPECIES: S9 family peptidase [Asticcacaulis]|uniref:alpha/beta hydrolase family protein n=1 Tax=Asticcacaulis TaxID=76890 RepID=UPI001AE86CEA|nr:MULTISPECIES: alpha/beta fold hydrolase [Asticcacaulis]MBP2158113.1 dipeptidyl aminopeptidase/acylaminoacyl peptidase [Asticcacaulis solisilvae]MDR6799158.1 dipeptidyl aminopeptidase/acylaminoacyl peptidase [Asticcacaulis sp. BE141]
MTINRRHTIASAMALMLAANAGSAFAAANPLGAPPPLEVYGHLPAISHVTLSPSGTHVGMVMRKGTEQFVVDYDIATKAVEMQPVGKLVVEDLDWVDDTYMTFVNRRTLRSGETMTVNQGLILNVRAHKTIPIGTGRNQDPFLYDQPRVIEKDGRKLIYMMLMEQSHDSRLEGRNIKLYSVDPATGKATEIWTDIPVEAYFPSGKGDFISGIEYKWDAQIWRLKFNQNGDWKTVLERRGRLDLPELWGLGRDDTSVTLFMNDDTQEGYYEVKSDGTLSAELNPDNPESRPVHNRRTKHRVGFANYGDWVSYDFADPVMKTLPALTAKAFEGYRTSFAAYADDPRKVVVYSEGEDDAGTYTFVDFAKGGYTEIGRTYPDLAPEWIAQKTAFDFTAADGLELRAYLTLPPGREAKDLPLIVLPHGAAEGRDNLSFEYDVQALASRGYAVLQVNSRGSDGKGRAFNQKGYGEWGRKMQTDLSDGVRYLAAQGKVDAKRVCIAGWSAYGGYAALAGVAFDPGIYRCAASVSGVSDLKEFVDWKVHDSGGETSVPALYWKRMLGDQAQWGTYSPAQNAAKIGVPVLVMHGKDDTSVPIKQSQIMVKALQAAGKPYEFVELANEDHFMSTSENRLKMLQTLIKFMEKNNPAY